MALIEHENGHRDFGIDAANEIEKVLLKLTTSGPCIQLERRANIRAEEILDKYISLDNEYDANTNHGAKTGAIFP